MTYDAKKTAIGKLLLLSRAILLLFPLKSFGEILTITPSPYDYGSVDSGKTASQTFTVKNVSNEQMDIGPTGTLSAPFAYVGGSYPGRGGTCDNKLKKNETCTLVVAFSPTQPGSFSGTLSVYAEKQGAVTTVNVALTGTCPVPPELSLVQGTSYDFQGRSIGSTTTKAFTLQNKGPTSAMGLTWTTLTAPYSFSGGVFPGNGGTCSTSLAGGSSCTFVLAYDPVAAVLSTKLIEITASNAPGIVSLTVTGLGQTVQPQGTTDVSFGTSGVATPDTGNIREAVTSLSIASNEKLVAGGITFSGFSNDFIASVQNLSGSLDLSFNGDGLQTVDLGHNSNDVVQAVLPLSTGQIFLAGYSDNHFAAVRLTPTGSLDPTFNGNGIQVLDWGGDSFCYHGMLDSSENGVLVGSTNVNGYYEMAVVRLNSSGALDPTFNGEGTLFLTLGNESAMAFSGTVQNDGRILVGGLAARSNYDGVVVRLVSDGSLDSSFGIGGVKYVDYGGSEKITHVYHQANDGKIVLAGRTIQAGTSNFAYTLTRLNSDGSFDTSFATNGKYRGSFIEADSANATVVQSSNGTYYVAWVAHRSDTPSQNTVKVSKFNSSGQLDTAFGSGGTLTLNSILMNADQNPGIAALSDGRVVVGGTTVDNTNLAETRIW